MKPSRMLPGALVAASLAIASAFAAAPAAAATLPPGQKITIIDQDFDQFFNVDPANAHASPVGTPPALIEHYITGVDVDDAGHGYAVAQGFDPSGGFIYEADANTGLLGEWWEVIIETGEVDTPADDCSAIDYTKGVILLACAVFGEQGATSYVGTVDVSADEVALLTPRAITFDDGFIYFTAIAQHPTNGTIYGFSGYYSSSAAWIITLDVEQYPEQLEYIDEVEVWGADFDRDGQLWLSTGEVSDIERLANPSFYSLATFDFTTEQPVIIDVFSADPLTIRFPEAITVWGQLAATGSRMDLTPAIAASGILLLGAMLAAGTMVLRRRNANAQA